MAPGLQSLSLADARRHLKMSVSILEMLKGNTEPEDLARLRQLWVTPYEDLISQRSEDLNHDLSRNGDARC